MPLPSYAEHGGEHVLRPPFQHEHALLRGFLLQAREEPLQALCDRHFNEPSRSATDYRLLSSIVLLTITTIRRLYSLDERDRRLGWGEEIDVAFWVPLLSSRSGTPHPCWFIPYIFVDNPYALIAGREIYGFPKTIGLFQIPQDPADPAPYTVDVMALRSHAPGTQARFQRLFEVVRTQGPEARRAASVLRQLRGLGGLLPMMAHTRKLLLRKEVSIAFLRQLRDIADPDLAAYQEIVEAPARVTRIHGGTVLTSRHQVRFTHCESHPIARDLGLRAAGHDVQAAFVTEFDFVMERGRRIWCAESSAARTSAPQPARPCPRAAALQKIAILGGGIAALTTALELTSQPDWRDRYEVTLYQLGWRLGGKGASGRNLALADRIEEHGLHIWFGCYENAFRLMRRVYTDLDRPRDRPLATWREAFHPHSLVVLEECIDGQWRSWPLDFPENRATPGEGTPIAVGDMVRGLWEWTRHMIEAILRGSRRQGPFGAAAPLLEQLAAVLGAAVLTVTDRFIGRFAEIRARLRTYLEGQIEKQDEMRRLWIRLDLALTNLFGILKEDVLNRGFHTIDCWDYREWLASHGASPITVRSSPVRVLYELVFAYEDGDPQRPNFAAGACLQTLLRILFGYKGAFMWKMQAGMGDVVIAPMYQVLRRRGVQFRFFHRIKDLGLSRDGQNIETIRVGRQVTLRGAEYEPLVDVKGLPCWPNRPLYDQIVEGEALRRGPIDLESSAGPWQDAEAFSLQRGRDYDSVVLGISVGALPAVCGEIIQAKPSWQGMVQHVRTVCTQSMQLWLKSSLHELGWSTQTRLRQGPVVGAYADPFSTWADMTHLVARERWPAGQEPGHCAYFCAPLAEPEGSDQQAREFLQKHAGHLWPRIDPAGLEVQYHRANVEPSDRYVELVG